MGKRWSCVSAASTARRSRRRTTSIPSTLLGGRRADLSGPDATRYITLNEIDIDDPTWFLNINGVAFGEDGAYEEDHEAPGGVPGGIDPTPYATGPMLPPAPEERGFKDTVKANPGEFTTIRARFELPLGVSAPQEYVYHCHIVEHEDNDMMRPFRVDA